jgi:tetratricopeptide (TPR) repeat protein
MSRDYKIVVQGNCQALSLSEVIRHAVGTLNRGHGIQIRYVKNVGYANSAEQDLPGHVREFIRDSDVFVEQVDHGDSQSIGSMVPPQTVRVRYPAIRMKWLWPFATVDHPRHKVVEPHLPAGIFGVSGADAILNRVMKAEKDPETALQKYYDIDPTKKTDLGRIFELTRDKVRELEKSCDILVWDQIERDFRDRPLFWYEGHPNWDFFKGLCADVLRTLPIGLSDENVAVALRRYGASHPFEDWQAPIHPRIAEYFDLKWYHPDTRYKRDVEGWFTHRELARAYILYQHDEALHIGRWNTYAKNGDLILGEAMLREGLRRNPNNSVAAFVLAQNLWRQNRAADAVGPVEVALNDPDSSKDDRIHALQGGILGRLGWHSRALAAYRRALAINPEVAQYHLNAGISMAALREAPESILEELLRAAALDPFAARYQVAAAKQLYQMRRFDEAKLHVEKALVLSDFAPASLDAVIKSLTDAGWALEAMHIARRVAEVTKTVETWQAYVALSLRNNRRHETILGYERLLELKPRDVDLLLTFSKALLSVGQHQRALDAAYRALGFAPDRPDLRQQIADAVVEMLRVGESNLLQPPAETVPSKHEADSGSTNRRRKGSGLRVIPGKEAYASLRHNRTYRWARHKADQPPAPSRTRRTLFLPSVSPKFRLKLDDKIFTIGSCFARHIEAHLEKFGYRFPTRDVAFFLGPDETTSANGFYNKFTTHSMLNEIKWALKEEVFPEAAYFADGDGRWQDGQLAATFASKERAMQVRGNVETVMGNVAGSGVLILTLGLVEAWHDAETDLYMNIAPPSSAINANPGRFSVHVLDYQTNLECLEAIYDLIQRHNPDLRFIVTVSPVPLGATFTGQDIAVANSYSKATLRAVAGDFAQSRANVDYYPSFEAVTESSPVGAWMDDAIHVRNEMVDCVITYFLKNYLQPEEAAAIDVGAKEVVLKKVATQTQVAHYDAAQ